VLLTIQELLGHFYLLTNDNYQLFEIREAYQRQVLQAFWEVKNFLQTVDYFLLDIMENKVIVIAIVFGFSIFILVF